ncbi:MAG: outer membrane autotransporter protein [Candidatus Azotimanducaceae bacterium]|jgi:outer membrane autotransporter protein
MKIFRLKFGLLTTVLALSSVFAGNVALAADGLYISGQVGSSKLGHTIERNTEGLALPVPDTSGTTLVENSDAEIGVAVGYLFSFSDDQFYIGPEAYVNYESAETRNINGVLIGDVELNYSYGARLLGGVNITDEFSVYTHIGVKVVDFDLGHSYTFAPPVRTESDSEVGFSYGVGAAYDVTDNVALFIDYTIANDFEFGGIPEVAGGTGRVDPNEIDMNTLSFGLKYSF